MDFAGVFPALVTPFAGDGSVSAADLKHNIQQYNLSLIHISEPTRPY